MGNCISAVESASKAKSDAIDKQIEEDSRQLRKECKVLLLGQFNFIPCAREDDGVHG